MVLAMVVALMLAVAGATTWHILNHGSLPSPAPRRSSAAAAATPAPAPVPVPPPPPADPWHGLKAGPVNLEKAENGDLVYAVGVLRNDSDRQRFGIKVELTLYNEQGEKVGSASDYAPSLVPGKEWKFRALVLERNPVRAAVTNVTEEE